MKLAKIFKGDRTIWVVFFLLSIVSLLAVYSSIGLYAYSAFASKTPTTLFLRHLLIVVMTYVVVVMLSRVNYRYFSRFAVLGYWAAIVLLVVLLALNQGRWVRIPVIGQFQPSEIAKVVLIIFVARMLALKKDHAGDLGQFLMLLIYIAAVVVLVLPENFSTAALIFLSAYIVMYFGGANKKYWWRLFLVGVVLVIGFLAVSYYKYEKSLNAGSDTEMVIERQETWGHRVYSWINPKTDELTQENMARMAIARGCIARLGIGTTVHARLMTQAHNDFIYAIIIEETGMVGGLFVFVLYSIFYFRCVKLTRRCKGRFGALTVAGLGTMIYLQALVNMCVAVGVLPVTGQTLPFISYGGTAYLFLGCALGVIQSVAADVETQDKAEEAPVAVVETEVVEGDQEKDNK